MLALADKFHPGTIAEARAYAAAGTVCNANAPLVGDEAAIPADVRSRRRLIGVVPLLALLGVKLCR